MVRPGEIGANHYREDESIRRVFNGMEEGNENMA